MIRLFTDSASNLSIEMAAQRNITMLPMHYHFEEGPALDCEADFDGKKFYDAMRSGALLKTSLINVDGFMSAFRPALEAGDDVLYIGISGGVSSTMNAAAIAAQELRGDYPNQRILTLDSLGASLGEGMLVLEAAQLIQEGKGLEAIRRQLVLTRNSFCQFFTVDDLKYLKRGGRISGATALVGTMLNIKPILKGNDEGHIVSCGKVRGKKQALLALAEKYGDLAADKEAAVGIAHADEEESARFLESELRQRGLRGSCLTVCYEPVTGSHVGPGTIALFFHGTHR